MEETFNRRRQELQVQLDTATEKMHEAKARHSALRAELGSPKPVGGREGLGDKRIIRATAQCLGSEVGPALSAVADLLDSGDPCEAKLRVQEVLSRLFVVHGELSSAAEQREAREPRQYNLADGEGDGGEWEESDEDWEDPNVAPREKSEGPATGAAAAGGAGPWRRQKPWPSVPDLVQGLEASAAKLAAAAAAAAARGNRGAQGSDERPSKKGKTADDSMEEQAFEDMAVPPHMAQAAALDQATQQEIRESCIREFCAAAEAKGVDVSDVDLANVSQQQLEQLAAERLA